VNLGSHAEIAIRVSAALVNALTPGERQGRPYLPPDSDEEVADQLMAEVAGISRAFDRPVPALVPAYRAVAEQVRPVFEFAEDERWDDAAATVNALLERHRVLPRLERHDHGPWHLHFHGPEAVDPTGWAGACATGLATVLGSEDASRLGVCGARACDRVFVDVSRNGTRRFCSTACQNRVKAAAHRARAAATRV